MIARLAYGALFVLLLPGLLAAWSARMSRLLPTLPVPDNEWQWVGALLLATGVLLVAWAMTALWRHGGGLPMNAFPPPKLVERGPYSLLPHPIYVGFAVACFGSAIAWRSAGGLWVVAPSASLCALALGAGHETPSLRRRFGRAPRSVLGGAGEILAACVRPAWKLVLRGAERVANSWREWRVGPVRVINHGLYAGLAAAVGVAIAGSLLGGGYLMDVVIVAIASLVGAALWGQYWVGSRTLLRPFGYFGSVLAILVVVPSLAALGRSAADLWALAGAAAVAAPWVQVLGRFRCLVQGCCHGAPVERAPGIVYRHPRSRVCWVSHLGGVPLHATPVYSMGANVLIGSLMSALWCLGAPTSLILGGYLILEGAARFVEESRRGEATTPTHGGLRLYQWCAAASALVGAAVTCAQSPAAQRPAGLAWPMGVAALLIGLLHWMAMGVDFPESNRRFGRLV